MDSTPVHVISYKDFCEALGKCKDRDEVWCLIYGTDSLQAAYYRFPTPEFLKDELALFLLQCIMRTHWWPETVKYMANPETTNRLIEELTPKNHDVTYQLLLGRYWPVRLEEINVYGLDAKDPKAQLAFLFIINQMGRIAKLQGRKGINLQLPKDLPYKGRIRYILKHRYEAKGLVAMQILGYTEITERIDKFSVLFTTKIPSAVLRQWIWPVFE